jgi:hypothetical protein
VAPFGYHLLAPVVLAPVSTLVLRIPSWLFGPPLSQGREDLVEFFLFNFRMDQQWRDQSAKAAVDYHWFRELWSVQFSQHGHCGEKSDKANNLRYVSWHDVVPLNKANVLTRPDKGSILSLLPPPLELAEPLQRDMVQPDKHAHRQGYRRSGLAFGEYKEGYKRRRKAVQKLRCSKDYQRKGGFPGNRSMELPVV